jgi:hypothetical protein
VPNCPPPADLAEQTATLPLRDALRLPGDGRVRLAQVTDRAVLEVVRADAACDDSALIQLPAGGSVTVLGLRIAVISINPSRGGMPPTVQLRVGPA